MKKHWAVVVPLLVLGCGAEDTNGDGIADGVLKPDSVSVVAPATPKGTVSGQVLDTRMAPISGAEVRLLIGSDASGSQFSAQTDGAGNFMFANVPAGSHVLVTATKQGYATLRTSAEVPSTAGNIPINNGNASLGAMLLAETTGSVSFTLYTSTGHPAANARAYLEATPAGMLAFNSATASATSSVIATPVVANEQGIVTFTGVPAPSELARLGGSDEATAGAYRLFVDPVDINGDGIIDAAGTDKKFFASKLLSSGSSQLVSLELPTNTSTGGAFNLVATNLASLRTGEKRPVRNLLRDGESIFLAFSQPVARESLLAILTDETGREQIDVTVTPNATGDVYSLTPAAGRIAEGQEYNLILRATSAYSGAVRSWKGMFVRGDVKTPRALQLVTVSFKDTNVAGNTTGVLDAGECVVLTFNQTVTPVAGIPLEATLSGGPEVLNIKTVSPAPYPSANPCFPMESTKFPIDSAPQDATTRFFFSYGTPGAAGYPPINPTTATAKVRMEFTKFQPYDLTAYYETAWGIPIPATTILEQQMTRP